MPETDIDALFARIPELEDGVRFPALDPAEAPVLFDEVLAGGDEAIGAIVDRLREIDDGTDWKARFLLHALATHVSGEGRGDVRKALQAAYAGAAVSERPAPVRTFVLQQLRWIADDEAVATVAPVVVDGDRPLADAALAVMVSVGRAARPALREALEAKPGEVHEAAIRNALAQIG